MVNELQKVEYKQPLDLKFNTVLDSVLIPSKNYLKAMEEYHSEHAQWKVDFEKGDVAKNAEPQPPKKTFDGLNMEMLALELQKVLPAYASSEIGLPVVYNNQTKIYEMSGDNLESRLWLKLYGEYMIQYRPELANNPKIANQFRNAVQKMAKNAQGLGSDLPFNDKLNANLIAFKNGTYRFKENTLTETQKEDYQTTRIEFDYVESPKRNIICDWIEYILEDDAKTMFQLIGRIFYRQQTPQVLVFATGEGSNGKSAVMGFVESLVGSKNTSHATLQSLSSTTDKFASSQLFGKMVNIETDMPAQHIKQTGTLKTLSGNDVMSAEYKGLNKFTFTNYALMIFTTNNMPTFSDTSHGFKRRILTLPFNKKLSVANEEDAKWYDRYKNFTYEEKSEFISYCIQEYRNVLFGLNGETKGEFYQSENAINERSAFIENNDMMANFIEEFELEFTNNEEDAIPNHELLDAYNTMLRRENLSEISARKFMPEFKRKAQSFGILPKSSKKRIDGKIINCITNVKWNEDSELNNIF